MYLGVYTGAKKVCQFKFDTLKKLQANPLLPYRSPKINPSLLKDTVTFTPLLNRKSNCCDFFGVDSAKSISKKITNQLSLSILKNKEQNILDFPPLNIDKAEDVKKFYSKIWENPKALINKLYDKGSARWTISSKLFGENGKSGTHTIGLVLDKDSKNLFILDSLSKNIKEIKQYNDLIKSKLFKCKNHELGFNEIICSTKPQQLITEYCCNNWTHANIEAVKNSLANGVKIKNQEQLNKVLPSNINKVLEEQQSYVKRLLNNMNIFQWLEKNK